jgi:tagaturonate epimerase
LIHVSYKIAAEMGRRYTDALVAHEGLIAGGVARNVLERHVRPLFLE